VSVLFIAVHKSISYSWFCAGQFFVTGDPAGFLLLTTLFDFIDGTSAPIFPASFQPKRHVFCGTKALESRDGLPHFMDNGQTPRSPGDFLLGTAPPLDGTAHKGQAGRIGVLGGSVDYAGAPFYAGMAALRVGAELLYLLTAEEATGPIKSYSPELMVSSVYNSARMTESGLSNATTVVTDEEQAAVRALATAEIDSMVAKVVALLPRLHSLAIGPGLCREPNVLEAVARIIEAGRDRSPQLPLILDADGLWLVNQRPDLMKGYSTAVLTPNAMEYKRLSNAVMGTEEVASLPALCDALGGPTIVRKGATDQICQPGMIIPLECSAEGAPRRPGGLGDFLAGTLAVLVSWAHRGEGLTRAVDGQQAQACAAACALVRRACLNAYTKRGRAMVAPDVLEEVGGAYEQLVAEAESNAGAGGGALGGGRGAGRAATHSRY
jgi:ATP-dependent NAD(P)H-hydrate dehydratase